MRIQVLSALAGLSILSACASDAPFSSVAKNGAARIALKAPPLAATSATRMAVAARAEAGGKLVVSLVNPVLVVNRTDTTAWDGSDTLRCAFEGLMPGAGYRLVAQYIDARGVTSHRDSIGPFALGRAEELPFALRLQAVLGKVLLQFPAIPEGIDSLCLSIQQGTGRWSTRIARPSAGRGSLRIDSLPLGVALKAHLRAWTQAGDTLYFLDTGLTLDTDADMALAWSLGSALARTQGNLAFLAGGEASGLVGFAGAAPLPSAQTGRLLFTGFSDSGQSDWVRLTNPGATDFEGTVRIARGTIDTVLSLALAPGQSRILTRASADQMSAAMHPLRGSAAISASVATVTWSSTGGSVWSLSSGDGSVLFDMVHVLPGKNGWPSLNTSNHRTAYLRPENATAMANDAGSGWCSPASDDPAGTCP
jgi:hypothetical protein